MPPYRHGPISEVFHLVAVGKPALFKSNISLHRWPIAAEQIYATVSYYLLRQSLVCNLILHQLPTGAHFGAAAA